MASFHHKLENQSQMRFHFEKMDWFNTIRGQSKKKKQSNQSVFGFKPKI
jgi:hypothetical protein